MKRHHRAATRDWPRRYRPLWRCGEASLLRRLWPGAILGILSVGAFRQRLTAPRWWAALTASGAAVITLVSVALPDASPAECWCRECRRMHWGLDSRYGLLLRRAAVRAHLDPFPCAGDQIVHIPVDALPACLRWDEDTHSISTAIWHWRRAYDGIGRLDPVTAGYLMALAARVSLPITVCPVDSLTDAELEQALTVTRAALR